MAKQEGRQEGRQERGYGGALSTEAGKGKKEDNKEEKQVRKEKAVRRTSETEWRRVK